MESKSVVFIFLTFKLIKHLNFKKNILFINLVLSIFLVNTIDASIYSNHISKDLYVLDPLEMQYKYGFDDGKGVGGANLNISSNLILEPQKGIKAIEEDPETIKDIKLKNNIKYYIVQKGDSIAKIAKKFGISQDTIRWENNLNSKGFLKIGQKLTILPITGIRYTVKKGDNLSSIAKKTKSNLVDIKRVNELKNNYLKVGQKLLIPHGQKIVAQRTVQKKNSISTTSKKKAVKYKTSNSSTLSKMFIRPSNGKVTSPFGYRWGKFHYGIDFSKGRSAPIMAAASGVVVKVYSGCRVGNSSCGGGYGNSIVIQHANGYQTRYAHLISTKVKKGQKVVQGQVIGGMGNTGHVVPRPRSSKSTAGTHLHFEIIKNGKKISPNFLK